MKSLSVYCLGCGAEGTASLDELHMPWLCYECFIEPIESDELQFTELG
jgi:hypothetical protein